MMLCLPRQSMGAAYPFSVLRSGGDNHLWQLSLSRSIPLSSKLVCAWWPAKYAAGSYSRPELVSIFIFKYVYMILIVELHFSCSKNISWIWCMPFLWLCNHFPLSMKFHPEYQLEFYTVLTCEKHEACKDHSVVVLIIKIWGKNMQLLMHIL